MSVNYASGLSPYDNKGVCGLEEIVDSEDKLIEKVNLLSEYMKHSKHCVLYCGAGISTAAGIPDFRGPKGVWTLEFKGLTLNESKVSSFDKCIPTFAHRAIVALINAGYVKFVVSQNIDGLFLKAGIARKFISELHGNYFLDECNNCNSRFIRNTPSQSLGCKPTGEICQRKPRPCRGILTDTILDWEQNLPFEELDLASEHSTKADLAICLGTTLQINPAGLLPLKVLKRAKKHNLQKAFKKQKRSLNDRDCKSNIKPEYSEEKLNNDSYENNSNNNANLLGNQNQLVIVNLQTTKYDKVANLVIHHYIDRVMTLLCQFLNVNVNQYDPKTDPTNSALNMTEWKR